MWRVVFQHNFLDDIENLPPIIWETVSNAEETFELGREWKVGFSGFNEVRNMFLNYIGIIFAWIRGQKGLIKFNETLKTNAP